MSFFQTMFYILKKLQCFQQFQLHHPYTSNILFLYIKFGIIGAAYAVICSYSFLWILTLVKKQLYLKRGKYLNNINIDYFVHFSTDGVSGKQKATREKVQALKNIGK